MRFIPDWKRVLRKAWSMRLMLIAALLSGVEVILPFLETSMPRGAFAVLAFFITVAAMIARVIQQKELHDDSTP